MPKSIGTRVAGIFTAKVHPYSFYRNSITWKNYVEVAPCLLIFLRPQELLIDTDK